MNKIILLGRLVKEPELRLIGDNSTSCCNFTLAVNRKFAKQGDEQQADFIPIVAWGKTAEFCGKYFQRGQQIALAGRIQVRKWVDKEGGNRYSTEVIAEEVYFADSKRADSKKTEEPGNNQGKVTEAENTQDSIEEDMDDLPF